MKSLPLTCFFILMFSQINLEANETDRIEKMKQLDEACEVARTKKLIPLREKFVKECVEVQKKEKEYCIRFYRQYGERSGNTPPLFYDLPACVEAFEYRRSYRKAK